MRIDLHSFCIGWLVGALLLLVMWLSGDARADTPVCEYAEYAVEIGDDDCDGLAEAGEAGWDCTAYGRRVCMPGNGRYLQAGQYDEDGILIDRWPLGPSPGDLIPGDRVYDDE